MSEPLAYRVSDAALVSGLSRSTLFELIADGRLASIKVCGRRLIPAYALRELLFGSATTVHGDVPRAVAGLYVEKGIGTRKPL